MEGISTRAYAALNALLGRSGGKAKISDTVVPVIIVDDQSAVVGASTPAAFSNGGTFVQSGGTSPVLAGILPGQPTIWINKSSPETLTNGAHLYELQVPPGGNFIVDEVLATFVSTAAVAVQPFGFFITPYRYNAGSITIPNMLWAINNAMYARSRYDGGPVSGTHYYVKMQRRVVSGVAADEATDFPNVDGVTRTPWMVGALPDLVIPGPGSVNVVFTSGAGGMTECAFRILGHQVSGSLDS